MEELSTVTTSNNDIETLKRSSKWIKYSYYASILNILLLLLTVVVLFLQYLGFKTLTQHNFKTISTFANLMLVRLVNVLITVALVLLTIILFCALPAYSNATYIVVSIFAGLACISTFVNTYIEYKALASLLENQHFAKENKELIHALYLMIFFFSIPPISVLRACGFLGLIDIIFYKLYENLFEALETVPNDIPTDSTFDWKEQLKQPSRVGKAYFISLAILIILILLTLPLFILS